MVYLVFAIIFTVAFIAIKLSQDSSLMFVFIISLSATTLGVLLAFQIDKVSSRNKHFNEFTESLKVLDAELETNLSLLKKIRNNITAKNFTYHALNYSLTNLLLYKSTTSEFGGKSLYYTLLSVRTRIESFNLVYSRAESFSVQRGLSSNEIEQIKDKINQAEYIIALCRTLIKKFNEDKKALLKEETYKNLEKALELEQLYRKENPQTTYEKLKNEVKL